MVRSWQTKQQSASMIFCHFGGRSNRIALRHGFLILALTSLLCEARLPFWGTPKRTKVLADFKVDPHDRPIELPITVNVLLAGFDTVGHHSQFRVVDPQALEDALFQQIPKVSPHDLRSGEALHTVYQLWYSVSAVHHRHLDKLNSALADSLQPTSDLELDTEDGSKVTMPHFSARADHAVRSVLAEMVKTTLPKDKQKHPTLVLLNPPKRRFVPPNVTPLLHDRTGGDSFVYTYSADWAEGQFTSWTSADGFSIVDLAAGPHHYGSFKNKHGAMSMKRFQTFTGVGDTAGQDLIARLVSLTESYIQHNVARDIQHTHVGASPAKIVVPVIGLRDHIRFNPLDEARFDASAVSAAVQSIFPDAQVSILPAVRHITEHDDVVAALAASVESRTSHTYSKGKWRVINRRHLNSRALLDSLSNAHDILADTGAFKLLEEDDSNLRLMPVFVVSSIVEENLLLDDGLMQAQHEDGVVVLQSEEYTEVPFFTGNDVLRIKQSDVTSAVVSGVSAALTAAPPPDTHWSPAASRRDQDFMWSYGDHPFGPFSRGHSLPSSMIDSMRRCIVLSNLEAAFKSASAALHLLDSFADEMLFDPLGGALKDEPMAQGWLDRLYYRQSPDSPLPANTVRKLHRSMIQFEDEIHQISRLMAADGTAAAEQHAFNVANKASSLLVHTEEELTESRRRMSCCSQKFSVQASWATQTIRFVVAAAGVSFLCASVWLLVIQKGIARFNSSRKRLRRDD